jgi:hypothetical protein
LPTYHLLDPRYYITRAHARDEKFQLYNRAFSGRTLRLAEVMTSGVASEVAPEITDLISHARETADCICPAQADTQCAVVRR